MNKQKTLLLFLTAIGLSGCRFYGNTTPAGKYYYLNPNKNLSAVGKVALVELSNNSSYPQVSTDVTKVLFQSLQKKQVFSLDVVLQKAPSWKSLQMDLDSAYTLEQLAAIRQTLKCDAILTGSITGYRPYPHMSIGLRLKLTDLDDGQLLWAVEQVWDSTDKSTENRIKTYYKTHILPGSGSLAEQLGTVSSIKFIKFVVYEVAEAIEPKR